jgi:hypothetical protein
MTDGEAEGAAGGTEERAGRHGSCFGTVLYML